MRLTALRFASGITQRSGAAWLAGWIWLACTAIACAQNATVGGGAAVDAKAAQSLQALVDEGRNDGLPGGIIVRIESLQDGRIWQGTSGPFEEARDEPIKATDAFRVASITKSFTAAVIWRLAEDGRIGIDDRISKYLPAELVGRIHVLNGTSYGDRITIRQLLCHCSGVYDYATDKDVLRYMFAHPEKHWTPQELIDLALRSGKPYFPPGQGQHYSDTGYLLLGMVIEKVTQKPLAQVYRELIYVPLGLHDTYLEAREPAVGPPLSHNYVGYLDEHNYDPTLDAYASGGQVSTTTDLAKFISAVMKGRFFKRPETLQAAMAAPELPNKSAADKARYLGHYLFYSSEADGVRLIGHEGFWGGVMFYDPDRDLVITGTSNQVDRNLPVRKLVKAFAGS
jgi:D-alanyl-D-alanine carboxypeptidase